MLFRAAAAIGLIAHAIDALGNWAIGPLGLRARVPFAVLLSVPLVLSSVASAAAAFQQLGSRAQPQVTDIADLANPDRGSQAYVTVEGLVAAEALVVEVELLDQDGFVAGTRIDHYYLLRDPGGDATAVIVRSPQDDAAFRRRELVARIVDDPAWVEAAVSRLGAVAREWQIEPQRYLDEVDPGSGQAAPDAEPRPPTSAVAEGAPDASVPIIGTVVSPGRAAACDPSVAEACDPGAGDPHVYLLREAGTHRAVLLRSPHPPDAMPIEVTGLFLSATLDARRALDGDWLSQERAGLRMPVRRVLYDGQEPPFSPPSFSGPIVGGSLAALLLVSAAIGYPIFRGTRRARTPGVTASSLPVELADDGAFVTVTGRLPGRFGRPRLTDETGRLRTMEPMEYELTRWRYGDAPPGVTPKQLAAETAAAGAARRLVLDVANQSVLVPLHPSDDAWDEAAPGRAEWLRRGRAAIRLRGPDRLDLILSFVDAAERDRLLGALDGSTPRR